MAIYGGYEVGMKLKSRIHRLTRHLRLPGLRAQYRQRRDLCVDLFGGFFVLKARSPGTNGTVYDGYVKSKSLQCSNYWVEKFDDENKQFPVISFVPPTSGMFLWVSRFLLSHAPGPNESY